MGEIHAGADKIEFFRKVFGQVEVQTKGNVYVKCPKCLENNKKLGIPLRKRKLAINIHKNDIFHCWVCGYKGRLVSVLKEYAPHSNLIEYIRRFADEKTLTADAGDKAVKDTLTLPIGFVLLATSMKKQNPMIKKALEYAEIRGFTKRDLWYHKVGISSEWPWINRLLMPSYNKEGELDYIVGRSWERNPRNSYWDTSFDKTTIVFNSINIDWSKELTITEGPMDLIKCNDNSVPLLGSDLSRDSYLFGQIVRNNTPILLAMDRDMAYKKMPKTIDSLLKLGIRVRVLDLGKSNDVGEMSKEEFRRQRDRAKEWNQMSLLRHKISQIKSTFTIRS
jgi:DNA primase